LKDGETYLQYRETHIEHVLRRRAEFTRLGVMAQSAVETTRGAVKCTEVSMGHSDALLDHVPGIRLELHLELPTLRRVALIGLLDPSEVLRVIGDKPLERRELDPGLRCCGFVSRQDNFV
jgi:hypothetical protein